MSGSTSRRAEPAYARCPASSRRCSPPAARCSTARRCTAAPRQTTGELLAANGRRARRLPRDQGLDARARPRASGRWRRRCGCCGSDRIDLMQIHNLVDWRTHLATLRDWKEEGRIRYLGITHYTSSAYAEVEAVLRAEKLDFLQINYALDDREAERARCCRWPPSAASPSSSTCRSAAAACCAACCAKPLPGWAAEIGCAELGAGAAEVRAQPSGGDLRDPGHAPTRAHGRQRREPASARCRRRRCGTAGWRRSAADGDRRGGSAGRRRGVGARQADDELGAAIEPVAARARRCRRAPAPARERRRGRCRGRIRRAERWCRA